MVYAMFVRAQWTVESIVLVSGMKLEKNYYVENHENNTTIDYQCKFVHRYIDYERWDYRWVQLNYNKAQKYFSKFPGLKEVGYSYVDAAKVVDMVEFHIDDFEYFIYLIKGTLYDGFLSVNFPEGKIPVMNIGHDEFIFKQYIFSKVLDGSRWENFINP